ncbi:MAG: fumarylacetoacetase [Alphaproteobacteria bacterium]|nr:fumarylacetoacetase [Alphaproteobacteria bacterium]
MTGLDETHDPSLVSWVESANRDDSDFPIQNLPLGVFRRAGTDEPWRGGVAIGDQILDLAAVRRLRAIRGAAAEPLRAASSASLNTFMAMGPHAWSALRRALSRALRAGAPAVTRLAEALVPQRDAEMAVPATIGDFTDFYTSIHHATAVGRLFRPDNPLLPNYKWLPIAYHGRASSVGVSGQRFPRPKGQILPPGGNTPVYGPCKRLDYELELGAFVGVGNALGSTVPMTAAEGHLFGLVLLNDWSARDIQAWEYQPLGPFLAKSFATTISPWIVSMAALAPYRVAWTRPDGDPQPLPHLDSPANRTHGAIDIALEVWIETERMRRESSGPALLSRSNFRDSYWTWAQMLAHHTSNGCNLMPGDLFGSGTQSGPKPDEGGALIELSHGGKQPVTLANGETRTFVEDGDTITFRAACTAPDRARIGFGACAGTVLPAT